jgi:hypothetical protein
VTKTMSTATAHSGSQTIIQYNDANDAAAEDDGGNDDDWDFSSCNTGVTTVKMSNVSDERKLEVSPSTVCAPTSSTIIVDSIVFATKITRREREKNQSRSDVNDSCRPSSSVCYIFQRSFFFFFFFFILHLICTRGQRFLLLAHIVFFASSLSTNAT